MGTDASAYYDRASCDECGRCEPDAGRGWRAYLGRSLPEGRHTNQDFEDASDEVFLYCPACGSKDNPWIEGGPWPWMRRRRSRWQRLAAARLFP